MKPDENSPLSSPAHHARIDLYRIILGENSANQKFEVIGVYIHALPSLLPVRVIRAILKDECEPQEIHPLRARCFLISAEKLNAHFLQGVHEASIIPLRSETYGAPPLTVAWHFFTPQDSDGLAAVIKYLQVEPF